MQAANDDLDNGGGAVKLTVVVCADGGGCKVSVAVGGID